MYVQVEVVSNSVEVQRRSSDSSDTKKVLNNEVGVCDKYSSETLASLNFPAGFSEMPC